MACTGHSHIPCCVVLEYGKFLLRMEHLIALVKVLDFKNEIMGPRMASAVEEAKNIEKLVNNMKPNKKSIKTFEMAQHKFYQHLKRIEAMMNIMRKHCEYTLAEANRLEDIQDIHKHNTAFTLEKARIKSVLSNTIIAQVSAVIEADRVLAKLNAFMNLKIYK